MTITFEPLHESHFPLLLKWLEAPHVKKWWDQDVTYTLELVREKYSSYIKGYKLVDGVPQPIQGFIIHNNQNPVGYIQIYNAYDFPRSKPLSGLPTNLGAFDIFIGEEEVLGQGFGSQAISEFLKIHGGQYSHIFADPDSNNIAAIKCYEKAGFKKLSEQEDTGEVWMLLQTITFITKQVLENAHYAKLAIEEYEGIGKNIKNIKNTKFEFFFGFNQKVMLDFAVLQICKIYDKSNKSYKKHTIFEIIEYLKKNKELADYRRVYALNLNNYLKNSYFKKICKSDLSNIEAFLYEAELISNVLIRSYDFEKLKTFRDKYIAHAEQINPELTKYLPSINAIDEFINIAIDLSIMIHNLFSQDSFLDRSTKSMKVATQNLVQHVIDGGSV